MTEKEQKSAAKAFAEYWKDKGYEKGESQAFWMSLLRDVYGVEHPEQFISFEDQVKLDHTSFIDGYIEATHVMIEQKGLRKDLRKGIKQSDGSILSPFQSFPTQSALAGLSPATSPSFLFMTWKSPTASQSRFSSKTCRKSSTACNSL